MKEKKSEEREENTRDAIKTDRKSQDKSKDQGNVDIRKSEATKSELRKIIIKP